ncbi:hypothetical protein DDL59_10720 [Neisseria gonorrhoeae]
MYCLRLRRLVLIFVNPLYHVNSAFISWAKPTLHPLSRSTLGYHSDQSRLIPQTVGVRPNLRLLCCDTVDY